jgi:Flp pilus assembly protein TadB
MELSILEMDNCQGPDLRQTGTGGSMSIYMVAFLVLMIAWFIGWIVLGVSGGLIHVVLGAALVSFALYFFRGRHAEADLRINR